MKSAAAILPALLALLLITIDNVVAQNGSALHCTPYIPAGASYNEPTGNLEFAGSNDAVFSAWGWPGTPMFSKGDYYSAYTFFVRSCNSTTLGLHRTQDDSAQTITDYIQVVNQVTGNCMTWENYNEVSNMTFAPCIHTPNTPAQLFSAAQTIGQYTALARVGLIGDSNFFFTVNAAGKIGAGVDMGIRRTALFYATTRK
ncbi:hypothetical protein MMC10_001583 [Thelotrema lepadinum]|nr:hypothetical protein [Thelotrema lepadinum]